ncbi:MAG: tRNA pseudouridine13 synthase [Cellvibrionaceae bacterium]
MINIPSSNNSFFPFDFPKAYPSLELSARFRSRPEDFVVNEHLGFEPSGSGEHWLLHVEKTGQNTHWVAEQIALYCDLSFSAVGYCGRKDRHAITRQWFSLYAPKQNDVDWGALAIEGVTILSVHRHSNKLRLGSHQANHFSLRLREVKYQGRSLSDEQQQQLCIDIQDRLGKGVPNYFGEQRFGRDKSNLTSAQEWFTQNRKPHPKRRSMVMSAARSYLFNLLLAERVKQCNWQTPLPGDVLDQGLPTGPLWGRGRSQVSDSSLSIEEQAFSELSEWRRGLEYCGLQQERRSLSLFPKRIESCWVEQDLQLTFTLPVGTFATAVLAEVAELNSDI